MAGLRIVTVPAMSTPPTPPRNEARNARRRARYARQRAAQDAQNEERAAQLVSDLVDQAPPMTKQLADELRPLLHAKNVANERTRGRVLRPLDDEPAPEKDAEQ